MDSLSFYQISLHSLKALSPFWICGIFQEPQNLPTHQMPLQVETLSGCVQEYRHLR